MDVGAAIRAKLVALRWTQARLSEESGVPEETISRIITGESKDPYLSTITLLAHALGETVSSLQGEKGYDLDASDQQRLRELAEWVNAKLGSAAPPLVESAPNALELLVISDSQPASKNAAVIPVLLEKKGATRIFRAIGDSMTGTGIVDGDVLFVRPSGVHRMAAGKIVVCTVRGRTFVKKLEMKQRRIHLLSANPRYASMELERKEIEFMGIVVGRMGSFA